LYAAADFSDGCFEAAVCWHTLGFVFSRGSHACTFGRRSISQIIGLSINSCRHQ
jgi:hypothetical protein